MDHLYFYNSLIRSNTERSARKVRCEPSTVRVNSARVVVAMRVLSPSTSLSTISNCLNAYLVLCEGLLRPSLAHLGLPHSRGVPSCFRFTSMPHAAQGKYCPCVRVPWDFRLCPCPTPG